MTYSGPLHQQTLGASLCSESGPVSVWVGPSHKQLSMHPLSLLWQIPWWLRVNVSKGIEPAAEDQKLWCGCINSAQIDELVCQVMIGHVSSGQAYARRTHVIPASDVAAALQLIF